MKNELNFRKTVQEVSKQKGMQKGTAGHITLCVCIYACVCLCACVCAHAHELSCSGGKVGEIWLWKPVPGVQA